MTSPAALHRKQLQIFRDGVTEKMGLVSLRDLWTGHGPRSSLPPSRVPLGFQPTLSSSSTIDTERFSSAKSIGLRRPLRGVRVPLASAYRLG